MATTKQLRDLAECWPIIFGKALSTEPSTIKTLAASGRPDFIDAKTEKMRSAITALDNLKRLDDRVARVVMICFVLWGEEKRASKESYIELALFFRAKPPKKKNGQEYPDAIKKKLTLEGFELLTTSLEEWSRL